jgi:hypothetical protein
MPNLITPEFAAEQLRTTLEADGTWLQMWIPIVSEAVASWLKDDWRLYVPEIDSAGDVVIDSSGDPISTTTVRPIVQGACAVELASMYRFREGEGTDNVVTPDAGYGYVLNKASTAMLAALRKTTLA